MEWKERIAYIVIILGLLIGGYLLFQHKCSSLTSPDDVRDKEDSIQILEYKLKIEQEKYDSLLAQQSKLEDKLKEIETAEKVVNKKYDEIHDDIISLSADESIRYLSRRLSKEDSLRR